MRPRALAPTVLLLGALGAAGCSYDLDALRPRDGGLEGGLDAGDAGPGDGAPADDAAPPAQCTGRASVDANALPLLGPSHVAAADTTGAPSLLTPPTLGPSCAGDYSTSPSPEVVYAYRVARGPRLTVTTDAPSCGGALDTIVYARTSCDQGAGDVLGCDDDDSVLQACGCAGNQCAQHDSGLLLDGLTPGQLVYVVVDGFLGQSGPFRVALTENGVANAPPPQGVAGVSVADRCACPADADVATHEDAPFPQSGDTVSSTSGTALAEPGDTLEGRRAFPSLTRFSGAALSVNLAQLVVASPAACADATATFDLLVNDHAVQSFVLTAHTDPSAPVAVAYQTFGAVELGTAPGASVPVALRLREESPAGCLVVDFDRARPGTLTLAGAR